MEIDLEYLASIMSTEAGRKFIWTLLTVTDVDSRSMLTEALFIARHEGQRSIGLALLRAIRAIKANQHHSDGYNLEAMMRREAADRQQQAEKEEEDF